MKFAIAITVFLLSIPTLANQRLNLQYPPDTSVTELLLTQTTINLLLSHSIETIEDATKLSLQDYYLMRFVGPKTLKELEFEFIRVGHPLMKTIKERCDRLLESDPLKDRS